MSGHHGTVTDPTNLHRMHAWEYADATARLAATGFIPDDVNKAALQLDDYTLWVLSDDSPITWEQLTSSGGGGAVVSVNALTGVVVLDPDDLDDTSTTNKFTTAAEITKLGGIETAADVTDAANVAAAGATMDAETSLAGHGYFLDEDAMTSDDATKVASQQSIKAYVDAQISGGATPDASDTVKGKVELATTAETTTGTDATRAVTPDGLHDMTSLAGAAWFLDEDNMASDSATKVSSQQALKAYVDTFKTTTINYIIDGAGVAITTGIKHDLVVDFACKVTAWTILGDISGSIVVDIWRDSYANYPPVVGDSMTTSEKPTLSSSTFNQDTSLNTGAGWTINAGDILRFNVDSATTVTKVTIALKVVRS